MAAQFTVTLSVTAMTDSLCLDCAMWRDGVKPVVAVYFLAGNLDCHVAVNGKSAALAREGNLTWRNRYRCASDMNTVLLCKKASSEGSFSSGLRMHSLKLFNLVVRTPAFSPRT